MLTHQEIILDKKTHRPHVAAISIVPTQTPGRDFVARATVAAKIAALHSEAVDRDCRFPQEAIDELKRQRLLGALVPTEFGGDDASFGDIANVCYTLGRACASTAMIYAMHQVKIACIVRHHNGSAWIAAMLRKLTADQLLMASSTTEGNAGGDVRSSAAAVEGAGDDIVLDRAATVISYGAQADGIVTTARRDPTAAKSDQVLLILLKQNYTLDPVSSWDTLGMRGTCSRGFRLQARAGRDQIVPVDYQAIHSQSMTPAAHMFWTSAWAGVAANAVNKAHKFVKHVARQSGGQMPPGAAHLNAALASLSTLRSMITSMIGRFEQIADDADALSAMDFQNAILMLKVDASELAVSIVMTAMRAGGLAAYRQDGEFAIGQQLRDILSSPIMIHNDRIRANAMSSSLVNSVPAQLIDDNSL